MPLKLIILSAVSITYVNFTISSEFMKRHIVVSRIMERIYFDSTRICQVARSELGPKGLRG